jgi:phage shock protein C
MCQKSLGERKMLNMYRVDEGKKIAGVSTGLAKSFSVDPSLVRVLFIILAFALEGFGFWLYLALVILMPTLPAGQTVEKFDSAILDSAEFKKYAGFGLIGFGVYAVINNLNLVQLSWVRLDNLWPVALIVLGIVLFRNALKTEKVEYQVSKDTKNE